MKIDFYIDESGGINTHYFSIGGLILVNKNNKDKIKKILGVY
ncbi:hypothetical protein [Spiroplasma sp. SV19]|nr:hypothetical protein [Spiroplasma sp. SV19]